MNNDNYFICPCCNSTEYSEFKINNMTFFTCRFCTVIFGNPEKFSFFNIAGDGIDKEIEHQLKHGIN